MIILTPELKTYHEKIDEQHQKLINFINALDAMEKGAHTKEEIEEALDFLGSYIDEHFKYEENLMLKSGYSEYEWHMNWHKSYVSKYVNLREEFEKNGMSEQFVFILNEFIIKWIVKHIGNVDVTLGKFLQEGRK